MTASLKGKSLDEAAPIATEIEQIKNRNGGLPPKPPETKSAAAFDPVKTGPLQSAAFINPATNQPETGTHHLEAVKKVGGDELAAQYAKRESRNGPEFGYVTQNGQYVPRDQAAPIAKYWKQDLNQFDISPTGKEIPHSDEVAAKPGGQIPMAEAKPVPPAVPPPSEAAPVAAETRPPAEVPGAGPGTPSAAQDPDVGGTQEQQLLQSLQQLPASREGRDAPIISIADRVASVLAENKGALSKWWLRTKAGAEQYGRLLFGAPRTADTFWNVKRDWTKNRQVNTGVAREFIDAGRKQVPKQSERQAMGKYAEALMVAATPDSGFKTAEETLNHWSTEAKSPVNRLIYQTAFKLTEAQKTSARQMIQYREAKGAELQQAGLLNHLIEDYAGQHMVDLRTSRPPAALNQLRTDLIRGAFNTNFKYALRRLFETEFDLEQAGYKLKTTDVFDKIANYAKTANDVLADRAAVKGWMEGETPEGKPLFATGQHRTPIEGEKNNALLVNPKVRPYPQWTDPATGEKTDISGEYIKIDHPAFKKWQWAETSPAGKQIFVQGDVWAHRSIADELKNSFGRSRLYDIPGVDTVTRLNAQLKGIKLVGFFHQTKTASHALFHLTNPFGQPRVDPHDAFTQDAMKAGLQLFESHNQEIFSEGLASGSILQSIANLPKTLTGVEGLGFGDYLRAYQEYLFQDYIPRIKLATYRNALDRNLQRYGKTTDRTTLEQITATQVNSAFGEMNWRLMGINPTFRHGLRLALLAPDFQSAQHGFAAQIFTPMGGEQRMAAAIMIAGTYTAARVLNQVFDDDPHWQFKHAFSVVHQGREYRYPHHRHRCPACSHRYRPVRLSPPQPSLFQRRRTAFPRLPSRQKRNRPPVPQKYRPARRTYPRHAPSRHRFRRKRHRQHSRLLRQTPLRRIRSPLPRH